MRKSRATGRALALGSITKPDPRERSCEKKIFIIIKKR